MVTYRATKKVLHLLPAIGRYLPEPDNILGDWHVKRLVVDRQPFLILAGGRALQPILAPAHNVRTFPDQLADLVGRRLTRPGLPSPIAKTAIESSTVHASD